MPSISHLLWNLCLFTIHRFYLLNKATPLQNIDGFNTPHSTRQRYTPPEPVHHTPTECLPPTLRVAVTHGRVPAIHPTHLELSNQDHHNLTRVVICVGGIHEGYDEADSLEERGKTFTTMRTNTLPKRPEHAIEALDTVGMSRFGERGQREGCDRPNLGD